MSMASLERAIVAELREITKRPKLALKDMLEWSTSEEEVRKHLRAGEEVVHCPNIGVWVALRAPGPIENHQEAEDAKPA